MSERWEAAILCKSSERLRAAVMQLEFLMNHSPNIKSDAQLEEVLIELKTVLKLMETI